MESLGAGNCSPVHDPMLSAVAHSPPMQICSSATSIGHLSKNSQYSLFLSPQQSHDEDDDHCNNDDDPDSAFTNHHLTSQRSSSYNSSGHNGVGHHHHHNPFMSLGNGYCSSPPASRGDKPVALRSPLKTDYATLQPLSLPSINTIGGGRLSSASDVDRGVAPTSAKSPLINLSSNNGDKHQSDGDRSAPSTASLNTSANFPFSPLPTAKTGMVSLKNPPTHSSSANVFFSDGDLLEASGSELPTHSAAMNGHGGPMSAHNNSNSFTNCNNGASLNSFSSYGQHCATESLGGSPSTYGMVNIKYEYDTGGAMKLDTKHDNSTLSPEQSPACIQRLSTNNNNNSVDFI